MRTAFVEVAMVTGGGEEGGGGGGAGADRRGNVQVVLQA